MAPAAVAGVSIAAAGIGAFAQFQAASQARSIARFNEQQARNAAADALRVGEAEVERANIRHALLRGRQRAAIAASGTLLDQDTNLRILEDDALLMGADINAIRVNAQRGATGFLNQAAQFEFQESSVSNLPAVVNLIGSTTSALATYRADRDDDD